MAMPGKQCGTCKFCCHVAINNSFQCRRKSPVPFLIGTNAQGPLISSHFPNTLPGWWCGEWEAGIVEAKAIQSMDLTARGNGRSA